MKGTLSNKKLGLDRMVTKLFQIIGSFQGHEFIEMIKEFIQSVNLQGEQLMG